MFLFQTFLKQINQFIFGNFLFGYDEIVLFTHWVGISHSFCLETLTRFGKSHPSDGHSLNEPNFTLKRSTRITSDQISLPQNDFRHIAHVGPCGESFGELGFVNSHSLINSKGFIFIFILIILNYLIYLIINFNLFLVYFIKYFILYFSI